MASLHKKIVTLFEETADMLEVNNENPFKVRAFRNAARAVEGVGKKIEDMAQQGKLEEINGVGKSIAEHIQDIIHHGTFPEYQKLHKQIPSEVLEMLSIPGVGAKKARTLWKELNIKSIKALEHACHKHLVSEFSGFGKKSEEKILAGIEGLKKFSDLFRFDEANAEAAKLLSYLKKSSHLIQLELGGSLRRHKEICKDIDLIASSNKPNKLMDYFVAYPEVASVINKGTTKSSVKLQSGINVDLRVVSDEDFPFALHHFTGSKEHNVALRTLAKAKGFKLNEYGLFKGKKEIFVSCKNETDLFKHFGMDFIPPELRENQGELEAAQDHALPDLVTLSDLKGVLHCHSTYSDGKNSMEEMALAAKDEGFSYIGITDHSHSAAYAGGMKLADIKRQHKEIDALNKKLKEIQILKGIEVDILEDGSLDYKNEVLALFDFVIASVHSRFKMGEKKMTERICTALASPYVDILAHPTGRLLLEREAYEVNLAQVIECAAKNGVAIEMNANPRRLDIDWRYGKLLKEKKVKSCISPDAHSTDQLDFCNYGIGIARKGWLEAGDILNTLSADALLKHFSQMRKKRRC